MLDDATAARESGAAALSDARRQAAAAGAARARVEQERERVAAALRAAEAELEASGRMFPSHRPRLLSRAQHCHVEKTLDAAPSKYILC